MIEPDKQPLLDSVLAFSRDVRRAERERDNVKREAEQAYDNATTEAERMNASTLYLLAVGTADNQFQKHMAQAKQTYLLREARLAGERE